MSNMNQARRWLFPAEPLERESLSHFLGRFRRLNYLSPSALGELAGIGAIVPRWERFHLNPFPTKEQFEALAEVLDIETERLRLMLPPKGVGMKCEPIRLCGACYGESPCHQIEWQFKSTGECKKNSLRLLSKCPKCNARFKMPALWEHGCCDRCRLSFEKMASYQKIS
ncbi:hypothetical protein STA3757_45060 [Stanieria sp. NIES-3757]|nr:hypothetical protein STA3757_45060 [Stanieria sp. NIES-3757]